MFNLHGNIQEVTNVVSLCKYGRNNRDIQYNSTSIYIGVGRFRIFGGQGLENWAGGGDKGGKIPSRQMTS